MSEGFIPSVVSPGAESPDAWWFVYSGFRLLVSGPEGACAVPIASKPEDLGVCLTRRIYIGTFQGRPCYAGDGELCTAAASGVRFQEIRSLFEPLGEELFQVALTAAHLVNWNRAYQFCPSCRGTLKVRREDRAKECPDCSRLEFPRLSPAVIVAVEKGDTLLLARSARFTGEFYSVLAGFVEPGESLEAAVRREVLEETGIRVRDIAYFGSQPWPFPDSLMIAFTAGYESGEIRIDGEEIVAAGWYRASQLPSIPGRLSIARRMIDAFVARHS